MRLTMKGDYGLRAMIELATRYQAIGDRWYPHPGNAENAELRDELSKRYY